MQDLSKVIKDRIKNYDNIIRETETGYVIEVGDGIARIHGLDACMAGELIELDGGVMSMALNLEEDNVSVVILGDDTGIKEGSIAKRTVRLSFPQRRLKCRHFNILHRMQVVQWANILCIKARTF